MRFFNWNNPWLFYNFGWPFLSSRSFLLSSRSFLLLFLRCLRQFRILAYKPYELAVFISTKPNQRSLISARVAPLKRKSGKRFLWSILLCRVSAIPSRLPPGSGNLPPETAFLAVQRRRYCQKPFWFVQRRKAIWGSFGGKPFLLLREYPGKMLTRAFSKAQRQGRPEM